MHPIVTRTADRVLRGSVRVMGDCAYRLRRAARLKVRPRVRYVVSRKLWSIKQDGLAIMAGCRKVAPDVRFEVSAYAEGLRDAVVHFGSSESFQFSYAGLHPSNRFVTTLFHGFPEMHPSTREGIEYLLKSLDRLERIVVSCSLMKRRFLEWGAAETKITQIPLGVSLSMFHPVSPDEAQLSGGGWAYRTTASASDLSRRTAMAGAKDSNRSGPRPPTSSWPPCDVLPRSARCLSS